MGRLVNTYSGETIYLKHYNSFGRRFNHVDVLVSAPEVSNLHAILEWTGNHWTLKDISLNGIWIDGCKINKHAPVPLAIGQIVNFSQINIASWLIDDLSPPISMLVPLVHSENVIELNQYNLLPNKESPTLAIYHDSTKHTWFKQDILSGNNLAEQRSELAQGELISLDGGIWRTVFVDQTDFTRDHHESSLDLSNSEIEFNVSLDEEDIKVNLHNNGNRLALGEKSHNYLLLYLARSRLQQHQKNIHDYDVGWVNNAVISKELGLDEQHINILVFRLRQHFSQFLGTSDAEKIVERKRGKTRIGISAERLTIYKNSIRETPYVDANVIT